MNMEHSVAPIIAYVPRAGYALMRSILLLIEPATKRVTATPSAPIAKMKLDEELAFGAMIKDSNTHASRSPYP